ncbi:reverse transcriptase domain-containing protein [Tanacetum coccineum]
MVAFPSIRQKWKMKMKLLKWPELSRMLMDGDMGLVPMQHLNHNFKNKEKLKAINTVVKPKSYIAQLDGSFSINVNAKELLSEKMKPKNKDDLEQGLLNKKLKILNDEMNIVKEKLKAVKARLNFEETSRHSESGTLRKRKDLKERLGPRHARMFKRLEKGIFHRLGDKEKSVSAHSRDPRHRSYNSSRRDTESYYQSSRSRETEFASEKHHNKRVISQKIEALSESEGSAGGHWKSKLKKQKSSVEDDLSQPWPQQRITRQRITQSFSPNPEISFLTLDEEEGTERIMIIETSLGNKEPNGSGYYPLIGFNGEIIWPLGKISLLVKIGDGEHSTSAWMNFVIVRSPSPYNGIIGRPGIRKIQAVPSTTHGMLKFPVTGGILTLRSSKIIPIECAAVSKIAEQSSAISQATEERIKVAIHPEYLEQTIMIGSTLTEEGQSKLCDLLRRNLDVFSWKPAVMTGVPRHIAEHRLNIREGCPLVRQKKRGQAANRNQEIQEEVAKLVDAGIMKEVHYHSWLSNPVMVKKHYGIWRMCVDFKDLNKACPKDGYPLPKIDWKVESLYGFPFKCFLDAYKGYHHIKMAKEDEEKTAFITSQGIFCYSKMSFGLRNAGATYQHLVDKAFHKQIGRNLEVYVDDLFIKIHTENEIIRDIEETFRTLREINMKLNPKKCTFGVEEGMFLWYKVNTKGIKVCPDKADAVLSLPSPKCLKDVQKLKGKLASLNRFLAKSAEKSLPFFKTLKKCTKKSDFAWTEEAESAFKQMKQHIAKLPMLTATEEKEELIVHLAATKEAVSAVLMTEREAKQIPVYFVNRALRGPEINYTSMEKLVLALVHSSKRLKIYFQAHPIIVVTDQPIKQVLPRVSVKGQILADFIVERPEEDSPIEVEEELPEPWILFTDGSSCADGSGAGLILTNPEEMEFTYALRFRFEATNNKAEYEALIAGLRIAEQMGVKNLQANVDL